MYDYADDHHPKRKRIFPCRREWYDDAIHEEVDRDAIQNPGKNSVPKEEVNPAARREVNSSSAKGYEKVTEKTKQSGRKPALEGPQTQQSGGDPLQQRNWPKSEVAVDDERGRNIQNAAHKSTPQNCAQRVSAFRRAQLRGGILRLKICLIKYQVSPLARRILADSLVSYQGVASAMSKVL